MSALIERCLSGLREFGKSTMYGWLTTFRWWSTITHYSNSATACPNESTCQPCFMHSMYCVRTISTTTLMRQPHEKGHSTGPDFLLRTNVSVKRRQVPTTLPCQTHTSRLTIQYLHGSLIMTTFKHFVLSGRNTRGCLCSSLYRWHWKDRLRDKEQESSLQTALAIASIPKFIDLCIRQSLFTALKSRPVESKTMTDIRRLYHRALCAPRSGRCLRDEV